MSEPSALAVVSERPLAVHRDRGGRAGPQDFLTRREALSALEV
jgi:hypothetical protein